VQFTIIPIIIIEILTSGQSSARRAGRLALRQADPARDAMMSAMLARRLED